ncbi:hypothetical protein ACTA71_010256 [Dictyostelium dimigraforme]
MVKLTIIILFLISFILIIKGQDYSISNLNNINIFYPDSTAATFCRAQFYFLVQIIKPNASPIVTLSSDNFNCYQILGNITSSIFSCSKNQTLPNFSNYSSTFIVNGNSSKGSLEINYECKGYIIKIEIIQEVTWNTVHKYSSIVKLNGLLDSTTISVINNNSFELISLGKSYYRIIYYEGYFIPKLSNLSQWEISFNNSGTNITISTPYNIKKFKNRNIQEEIVDLVQFPEDGQVNYNSLYYFTSVIKFRSTSSLQRPINPLVFRSNFLYSSLPRPISGSIGNMTYIGYFYLEELLQYYYLYKQKDDLTFQGIPITTNYTYQPLQMVLNHFLKSTNVDNSSSSISLFTFQLPYGDLKYNYSFQYCAYSFDYRGSPPGFQAFPFGFSSGNNLNYNMTISVPTRGFTSQPKIQFYMYDYHGIGPVLEVTPSYIVNDSSQKTVIKSLETIYVNNFNYLVRFTISDTYGLKYIDTIDSYKYIRFDAESLVSGDIKNGVFEVLYDAVKYGPTFGRITFYNHIDTTTSFIPNQPFSILKPNSRINFPSIQLQSVDHLKDIKDISYRFNDVDITDKMVENIIYFSFNNIDNYKNLPIGFTLIDPRSLQDMDFFHGINFDYTIILKSVYIFAIWDEQNSRFYIKFKIPANTSPGVLDWMLVFNKENYLINTQLPDEYQLRIISTKFDNYGPIVTNIIKYPNSTTTVIGWLFTIEDEINGFKDGYITIRGSIDSSVYNITLTSSDMVIGSGGNKWKGDYLINIPYILNDCVSQGYEIYYAVFTDTFGNRNKYYKTLTDVELTSQISHDSTVNPFIYFLKDISSVLQVSTLGVCSKIDSTPPVLISFNASKSSIDVGSLDRSITFNFHSQDLEGLKDDQYPIVYITDSNVKIHQITSNIVSSNSTDIEYTCTMEVPIGFSHPYGFLISVYGFINRGGSYSGFSGSQLKELGFSWFVETKSFSVSQPIITGSSGIDNDGGDLWLYGRGFINTDTITLSNIIETYSPSMTVLSESAILIKNVKPSNYSINILLTNSQQPTIQSNTLIINPNIYYFNYSAAPLPTNKPQSCIGNPVCGGSNQGYCKENVGCICYSPYIGLDCTSKIMAIPQPKPNENKPTTVIENSNKINNNHQITSNISIIAIREVNSVTGEQVKIHYIDKWYYNSITSTISNYQSTIINNNISTTINATLEWFENKSNITFANQELIMNPSTIKYTVELSSYKFSNQLTNLQVIIEAQIQSNENNICSNKEFGDTTLDNSNYIKLQVSSNSIYGRFLKRGIVDGKTVTITNELLDSKLNSISKENNIQSYIGIEIGQYQTSVIIDPDFSLLLDNRIADSYSPNSICSTSSSTSLTKGQLIGIIIGASLFFIVLVIIIGKIIFSKSIHLKIIYYKMFKKPKDSY